MVRQVIFDVGQVLLGFDPRVMVAAVADAEEDRALLLREVFAHSDWNRLDRGEREEAVFASMRSRLPERLWSQADRLFATWQEHVRPKADTGALVEELHGMGMPLYILSNAPRRFYDFRDRVPGYSLMTGVMLSCEEGLLKPDPAIYRRLFDRFGFQPEECFFIDDSPLNVESAQWCGMGAVQFRQDMTELRAALRAAGIPVAAQTPSHQKGATL